MYSSIIPLHAVYPSTHPSFSHPPSTNPLIHPLPTYQSPTHLSIGSFSIHPYILLSICPSMYPSSTNPPTYPPSITILSIYPSSSYLPSIHLSPSHPSLDPVPLSLSLAPGQPLVPTLPRTKNINCHSIFLFLARLLPSLSVCCDSYHPQVCIHR